MLYKLVKLDKYNSLSPRRYNMFKVEETMDEETDHIDELSSSSVLTAIDLNDFNSNSEDY